jgi:hypothetical protein
VGVGLFKSKSDVLNAILIVFLAGLALLQAHGLVVKKADRPETPAPTQYTVERQAEVRPAVPPRTPGRSAIKVAQREAE